MQMLSPNSTTSPLPVIPPTRRVVPEQSMPGIPTVPNSPSMNHYPSIGMLPIPPPVMPGSMPGGMPARPISRTSSTPVQGLPAGFVPTGLTPASSPMNLPPTHSTPRGTFGKLYGGPGQSRSRPPSEVDSLSSDSDISATIRTIPAPGVVRPIPPPGAMHTRSRSESTRSHAPSIVVQAASSDGSASSKGTSRARQSLYAPTAPSGVPFVGVPPRAPSAAGSVNSGASAMSGHGRSLSLNAGNTPGFTSRTLGNSSQTQLRRVPSNASDGSAASGPSLHRKSSYSHYEPNEYIDAAFLASAEDLTTTNVLSPNTAANTRSNSGPGGTRPTVPSVYRPKSAASSALSYGSQAR